MEILSALCDAGIGMLRLIDAILSNRYRASYSELARTGKARLPSNRTHMDASKIRESIKRLRREGLVRQSGTNNTLHLTREGIEILKYNEGYRPIKDYEKIPNHNHEFIIVIFDIPEILHEKRDWFRRALKNIDFSMLQKSVWIGRNRIPKTLLQDIAQNGLAKYIEFFSAVKIGTLRKKLKNSRL